MKISRVEMSVQQAANSDGTTSQLSFGFQKNPSKNNYYNRQAKRVKERVIEDQELEQYISLSSLGIKQNLELEK